MEDLLKPTRTRLITQADQLIPVQSKVLAKTKNKVVLSTPEDALRGLQSQPDVDLLAQILGWLFTPNIIEECINIKLPGPKSALIINALVNDIVPIYWETLKESESSSHTRIRKLLLKSLASIAGIGALISRLRFLVSVRKSSDAQARIQKLTVEDGQSICVVIDVLESVLEDSSAVLNIWKGIQLSNLKGSHRSLLWKELISVVAAGRLLSVAAQAHMVLNENSLSIEEGSWLGDGRTFSAWLGRSISYMISSKETTFSSEETKEVTTLLSKAMTLGYNDQVIEAVFVRPLLKESSSSKEYRSLFSNLATYDQKSILYTILRIVSQNHIPSTTYVNDADLDIKQTNTVGGLAALITFLMNDQSHIQDALIEWLVGISGGSVGVDGIVRRAVVAALAYDLDVLEKTVQKLLSSFGDKLYIKHTPVLQQEVNAQLLLLVAGYIYRSRSTYLINMSRSSVYINAISNRLAASSPKSRFLGMIVGATISNLIDSTDKRMIFSSEEIDSAEGRWYQSLIRLIDSVGSIGDLISLPSAEKSLSKTKLTNRGKITNTNTEKKSNVTSKIISIEELEEDDNETTSEDDDIPTYEKPDTDEDEDEDPTLVQRNKPLAPVYIRDVIAGLRDIDNYDRHKLALSTASSLIRRKAKFGTEVSEHIEELATQFVGLGDKYNMEEFQKLRLQAMIAILLAQPLKMGQWFSRTYFNGDYSMGQRASILTTLSMGARELAGFQKEDSALTGADTVPENSFPSKKLPEKLHRIYALDTAPVNNLTQKLERTMIQPMAAEAMDKMTGPQALKVRTFSSRMEVEKKRKKAIPNELAKVVADGFFFPLTGLWRIHLQGYGDKSAHTSPFLLAHFIKTLALLLHASGPSTLSLPQMTAELWSLLLSLRTKAYSDITVLEALLFAFLTLLDVNEDKRQIAEGYSKELLETQSWVEGVFERTRGGSEEGERIRMLAAGVLVGTREVVDKYHRLLIGDLVAFIAIKSDVTNNNKKREVKSSSEDGGESPYYAVNCPLAFKDPPGRDSITHKDWRVNQVGRPYLGNDQIRYLQMRPASPYPII